jgi:endonuclease YncB( thermonuclease family)
MGNFKITGPDGKSYKIAGDTAEGAHAALMKHLSATGGTGGPQGVAEGDTFGAQNLAVPPPPDALAEAMGAPAAAKPATSPEEEIGPVPGAAPPVKTVPTATRLDVTAPPIDGAPMLGDDPLMSAMGAGAPAPAPAEDGRLSAITKKLADPGITPETRAQMENSLRGATIRDEAAAPIPSVVAPLKPAPGAKPPAGPAGMPLSAIPAKPDTAPAMPTLAESSPFSGEPDPAIIQGVVDQVKDGDTIQIGDKSIRLAALDCPEKNRFGGKKATALMSELTDGVVVTCEMDGTVTYDRLTGYCSVDGQDLGQQMIDAEVCGVWEKYDSKGKYIGTYAGAPMTGDNASGVIPQRFINERAIVPGSSDHKTALETRLADPNLTDETRAVLTAQLDRMKREGGPELDAPENVGGPAGKPDPFKGEGAASLLKRRGQQFARGATEIFASIPESLGVAGAIADRSKVEGAATASDERAQIIADIDEALKDPDINAETRAVMERNRADLLEGQGVLAEEMAKPVVPAKEREIFKAGEKVREASSNTFGTPDPRDTGFWGKVAEGGGSVAGFATSALLPGGPVVKTVGGATLGAETNMASLYKEAIEAGSDEETAQKAAKFGMAIGASEIVPINRALKILPRSWGPKVSGRVMKGFVEIAESSGEEAAQEYLATVANNIVASGLYDPERGWTEGANEAAIIGAILGGGLGAVDTLRGDPESMREPVMAPRDGGDDETAPTLGGNRPTPSAPTGPGASGNPPTPTPPAEPAADPLATAMGLEPPTIPKPAPLPLTDKDRVKETTKPGEKTDKPEFEVMDEVETVDGEERPTGRKVRVNLNTGDAEVVEDSEISGGAQASAGAGGAAATAVPEEGKQAAVDGSPSPSAEPSKPVDTAPDAEFVGDRPPPVRKFLTSEETLAIKTNPKAFQYKSNGDEEGVTDALRNIKTFDPNRAGQVVLFERKDGTLEVADGHQRTGLARRAAAAGQADVGGTAATVYREADGYTAEEVMGLAALKNIGEGSGSAVDAARVLRTRSESIADLGLPPNSALVRKAEGIRRLSDDAFGMVANGVATEEYGDVVGRNVPDKALQAEILAALTREKPDNLAQAAMIARDMAADVTTEEQTDMFGTLQVQKSLYVERAKVLDAAMKSQGILAKTFRNLVEREGVITSAGNQLDTKANAALVDEAGHVRQYLQSQANMKGPISDALTKAAELIRSGTPVTRAAEGFVRDVKAALQGTGEGSPAPAPGGTGNEGRAENQDTAVTPAPEPGDDLFAAMTGTPKPAAPKPSTTSPSDDLLSAMGGAPAQTGKTPDQVRAEAEAKVKAAQSKAGTTKPQADAGPLFDDQQKLPSEVANDKKPADPIEAGRELLKAYSKPDDGRYVPKGSIDLRDDPMVKALATKMAAAKTAEAREALADAFVLNEGRKAKKEFLVAIGPGGELLAVMKGDKSNVPMFAEVWRALEDGKVAYVTHNHPNSGDFSGNDLLIVGMGANRVVAMAHDTGRRHIATAVPGAIPKTTLLTDNPKPFLSASSELTMMRSAVYEAGYSQVKDSDPVGLPERMGVLHRGAMSLILHRMGIIEYSGGTVAEIEAQGFNFEEIYGRTSSTFRDRLGRAGFVVSERGDQPGNQAAGSAAGTAPSVSDRPDPGPEKPDAAPDDFDAAAASVLDDIFGSVQPRTDQEPIKKPAKRSDTDIGKDLGNLFNEDPAEFLSPMERAKAKAKKRPAQRDMFDLMDAAQPGERQTDLEDLIQDLKDRDRDLFGFGEDIISTEKYARAVPLFREALAGQDVKAQPIVDTIRAVALRFRASGLTRDGIERMLPYLKLYLQDVQAGKLTNPVEDSDVPGTSSGVELDSRDPATGNVVGQVDLPAADGRPGGRSGERGTAPDDQGGQRDAGNGLPDGRPAPVGTSGNPEVEGGKRGEPRPAVDRDGAGSRDRGEQRPDPDSRPAAHTERYAVDTSKPAVTERAALQAEADRLTKRDGVKLADEANVRQALPLLLPEQQDDVIKIEKRYAKPNGHGMLLTNGTGTGKTYSGGGAVKRFVQQGKDSILIAAPSQGILDAWSGALNDLGIPHTRLDGLKDMGKGVTLTTYANLGENETLADRDWDLVVTDEAHKLSQNADGDSTGALKTLRAITNHPRGRQDAAKMRRRAEWAKAEVMPDGEAKTAAMNRLFDLMRKEGAAMGDKPRAKVLFLSATPFAYVKNTDYAEGYLFDYPKDGHINGSRQDGQNLFMVENFGYRIRYHKLTRPDVGVDTGVFEREFHEKLKRDGVLSGRMLDIEPDYDRRFVLSEDKEGSQIDEILQFISDASRGKDQRAKDYQALRDSMKDTFNYLKQMQLLEAIKARKAIPDIEAHLKLGRKVVVFHDYNVGGGFNPFRPTIDGDKGIIPTAEAYAGYARLTTERPNVEKMNFTGFAPPVQALKSHFGDRAAVYNGTVPQKVRAKAKTDFQTDGSGLDVLIVQSAAGEAGISLHDTTGAHQRALVNLGMPVRPTTALQEEGRTRREGSVTDAPFRYYTIGTAWERRAFAKKIAERSGTVENLALGNQARTIRDSFIDAYGEAEPIKPAPGDGKGGKERDRAQASASPYDVAKTHYYGRMKTTGRRDQREGLDFYPTPEPVAFKMVEWAGVRAYESVLEPSAGDGAIARYLPEHARRTIVEPSTDLLSKAELRAPGSRTVNRMFEDYHVSNKHHAIVMNPPFGSGGKTAMDHLAKAMQHLKPGGRIVALIPTGPAADKRFEALWASETAEGMTLRAVVNLPAVAFEKAGTAVMSRVLVIDNVDAIKNDLLGQAKRVNLTGADTIAQLFDRMEDISLPERVQQLIDPTEELETEAQVDEDGNVTRSPDLIQMTPPPARMTKPIADSLGGFKLAQTKHSKTGDDLFVATAENRVDRDGYVIALGVAKQHGGWYSSFRGNGAIPGFQFKSEAQRQAFLDDTAKPVIGLEEPPGLAEDSPAFKAWFGDSKVVDKTGKPLVVYHGTRSEFDAFRPGSFFTESRELAEGYGEGETQKIVTALLSIKKPATGADVIRVAEYLPGWDSSFEDEYPGIIFNQVSGVMEALQKEGFDGASFDDGPGGMSDADDAPTWVAFDATQVKSTDNQGTFDTSDPRMRFQRPQFPDVDEVELQVDAHQAMKNIIAIMPELRKELDRLNLKRVKLYYDPMADWQGRIEIDNPNNHMAIFVGATGDAMATIHHEVIHALYWSNLFTPQEWHALKRAAMKGRWLQKYDINRRYPDLSYDERLEEAIAEEFGEVYARRQPVPKDSAVITAFNKIVRFLKAVFTAQKKAGFPTAEDVFGKVLSGEIGARFRKGQPMMPEPGTRQQAAKDLTGTDAFKAWFGKSKVVDKAGKPLVVYHGSPNRGIQAFYGRELSGWFSEDRKLSKDAYAYGGVVYSTFLRVDNPVRVALNTNDDASAAEVYKAAGLDINFYRGDPKRVDMVWEIVNNADFEKAARAKGHDGITVNEGDAVTWAIFEPSQAKSVNNTGAFDRNDPRIRYQKARLPGKQARAHMATPMGGQHLHIPDRNVWQELSRAGAPIWQRLAGTAGAARDAVDRARVVIQDRMLPLRRAQFMIEQRRGAPLPSNMDAYTVETTFSGKVGRHLFEIDEDYTKPIVSLIAQTKGRLTAENVGTWLYARHAIERNARIASINPRMPDGGSGMTNADARQILADAAASPDAATLDKIGVFIDLLRERSLTLRQNKGLITAAEANRWRTQYKHYVPLKGWADSDQSDAMLDVSGVGRRYSTRGAESRRALGRQSEAFNPLQAAITQAQEVAIRAEKNAVGQAVIELAKAYPSPAMWSVKQVKMKQVFNRTTGLVELRPEDPKTMFLDPNEMAVKVSGQEYRIMFHDPRLARSLGAVGADQMNGVIRILSILSRFFSMTRTMLNPEFMVTNAFRDFQTAQFGIQAFGINPKTKKDDRAAIALAMSKNWRKAFAGVYRGQGNKTNTTWSQYFKEFQQAGANISFWMLDQPEVAIGDLDKRIDLARGTKAARMLKRLRPSAVFNMRDNPVLAFIERTNLAVDNAIRLAAFIKARELGWEVQDAAFLAKELTVNFNRRGETTSSVNALYPFFNAAIQGSMRIAKALTSKRVAILVLMSVAAGTVLDLTNAALSDLDDDDELFYDKIPEYRSERNLHLVLWGTGDNPAAIPMPYGYNVFPYAGQQIGKVMRGIKTPEEAFGDVMAAAFGAFSPINGGSATTTAAPFIADPFIELAENRNFAGNTIYPAYPDTGAPDSQIFYPSATMASKYVAETLNDLTGGDFRQSGYLDFSPETLDHLSQFVGGSASAFWGRSTDILGKVLSGQTEEIEQRDVPFVRILTTPIGEYVNRDRYRQHSLAVKDANADAKAYTDKGMPVPAEVAAKAALYEAYLAAERELDGKGEWNPTKAGALTPREENAVWLDFSKKYLKVTRPKVTP